MSALRAAARLVARGGALVGAVAALFTGLGCGARPEASRPEVCASRLRDDVPPPTAPGVLVVPSSRLVVEIRVDTDGLLAALEAAIPRRVVERRGLVLGDAGKLDFTVDRGPFELGLAGDRLTLSVDLSGSARLCKPLGGLACVPYASCDPLARGRAEVSLVLGDDLRVPGSRVEIPITRRCTLTALEVDVTKDLEAEAAVRARQIRDEIDQAVPALEPLVRDTWRALATSVALGKHACARIAPTGLVQTGPHLDGRAMRIGVGVTGEVRVESPCRDAPPAPPLPRPSLDRGAAPGLRLTFPAIVSWDEASRAVAERVTGERIEVDGEPLRVTSAVVVPDGAGLRVRLTLVGRTCGTLTLRAPSLEVDGVRGAIVPRFDVPRGVDATRVLAKLVVPLPLDLAGMNSRIDKIARALFSKDSVDPEVATLLVKVRPPRLIGAVASEEGLAGIVSTDGDASVVVRADGRGAAP